MISNKESIKFWLKITNPNERINDKVAFYNSQIYHYGFIENLYYGIFKG